MSLSEQTQRDLETILETLDQRIHEMTKDPAERSTPVPGWASAAQHEQHLLSSLRDKVASLSAQ